MEARAARRCRSAPAASETERLPYYLRAPLPLRPAYVDYEDTAFTFDHPALKRERIARLLAIIS